jgi:hypothetical protein
MSIVRRGRPGHLDGDAVAQTAPVELATQGDLGSGVTPPGT